jgi:NAD(P)H-dependent FMN reductase
MNVVTIVGSPRPGSQSRRISDYLQRRLTVLLPGVVQGLVDLADRSVPVWDGDFRKHPGDDRSSTWNSVSARLSEACALICVVPEHHGIAPPALKNFLLLCRYELGHKPGLLVGVSATDGGSYPLAELRSSATKNNRICWIPEQVVVRPAKQMLITDDRSDEQAPDHRLKLRIDYALQLLGVYAECLRAVRTSGVADYKSFQYGM